jgi:mannose-6-phosphate isomerase-like protein (cupin superfamily)
MFETQRMLGQQREAELLATAEAHRASRTTRRARERHTARERRAGMFHAGDSIENPVTGETLVFKKTAAETDGEYVLFDCIVKPSGFVAAAHVHPTQFERFEVLEGSLTFKVDGQEIPAEPGDVVLVPAGRKHQFWNASDAVARFECEVRPALGFERLIETMFSLAQDGKTNGKGMPNPLRLAVIARAHFDIVRLPFPPAWMQRLGLALGAPLGRLLGYRSTYVRTDERVAGEVLPV